MKRIVFAAGVAVAALIATQASAAEPNGLWATRSSGGVVEIAPCGATLCGHLVRSPFLIFDPTMRDHLNRDTALRGRR